MAETVSSSLKQALRLKASHALAVGLHRRDKASIVLVIDDSQTLHNPYARDVSFHITSVLAKSGEGIYADIDGTCHEDDIEARYLHRNDGLRYRLVTIETEQALSPFVSRDWDYPLSPLTLDEIEMSLKLHDERVGRDPSP
jgi:hypothetical protein